MFTSTAFDEASIVDRREQVLQVMVHCALLNVPATGLAVLFFLARNYVTSGHDSRFCGTSRHVELFENVSEQHASGLSSLSGFPTF